MTRFDLQREPGKRTIPAWVKNENEQRVYEAVNVRIYEIEELIKKSKSPLKPREYKIAKSVICKEIGLSPSYIAKHENLKSYVDGYQRKLKRMSEALKEVNTQRIANAKKPEAMNKPELVKEIKKLRKRLDDRSQEIYVEQLKLLLESGLAESQVIVRNRIQKLENDLLDAQIKNQKLKASADILQRELVQTMKAAKEIKSTELALVENASSPELLAEILQATSKRSRKG